ncbi:hypothetical protein KC19_2G205400, partial [Ceratodon purpureus]
MIPPLVPTPLYTLTTKNHSATTSQQSSHLQHPSPPPSNSTSHPPQTIKKTTTILSTEYPIHHHTSTTTKLSSKLPYSPNTSKLSSPLLQPKDTTFTKKTSIHQTKTELFPHETTYQTNKISEKTPPTYMISLQLHPTTICNTKNHF